jgi:ADP-ribose pyrophosphatase YjhB (NUDIX family)
VAALILDDYKVLLTRRGIAPYRKYWDIPGGFLEHGEHPEDGLRRELKEELGLTVDIESLFGMYMDAYGKGGVATLNIIYLCKALQEPTKTADDVIAYQWFAIDQLPNKIAFKNTRIALQTLVESVR